MSEPGIERRAVDRLLAAHPDFDLLEVAWGSPHEPTAPVPWLIVVLGQRSAGGGEVWARYAFAIWKHTGAIHGLQADGSVTDEALPL